jgi:hypothetical protein
MMRASLVSTFFAAAIAFPLDAGAQSPMADSCRGAADIALVARALNAHGIAEDAQRRIMASIYTIDGGAAARAAYEAIIRAANASTEKPDDYSITVFWGCINASGDVLKFLGPAQT